MLMVRRFIVAVYGMGNWDGKWILGHRVMQDKRTGYQE